MLDTVKTPFHVVVRDNTTAIVYQSAHRTAAAAARRLATLISHPRKLIDLRDCNHLSTFFVEDYYLHDSGTPFNRRSLKGLRECYGLKP